MNRRQVAIPFRTGKTTVREQHESEDDDSEQGAATGGRSELLVLTVVPPRGAYIQMEVFASDTVLDIKRTLQRRIGYSVEMFHLFYEGMQLQDFYILGEIGICDGCIVNMIEKLLPVSNGISCVQAPLRKSGLERSPIA